MATLSIKKPDDSDEWYSTTIECNTHRFGSDAVSPDRSDINPVHASLTKYWRNILSHNSRNSYRRSRTYRASGSFEKEFSHILKINGCPILVERKGVRYEINGKSYNLQGVAEALARVTYKSCFEDDPSILLKSLYANLQVPENVKYCLENRVPYHFYDLRQSRNKIEVRLNCRQISENEVAIEISDGIWGTMTFKQLDVFCNFYRHNKQRGSWKNTSLMELYYKTIGSIPNTSDVEVMKAFLMQNRTEDMVEERALELVKELLEQYPDRLRAEWLGNTLQSMYVRGKDYDWKLENNTFKSDIQKVSTFVWQTEITYKTTEDEEGNKIKEEIESEPDWQGPICIDNMAKGSSLGDQFATRALSLLNDRFTVTIINTIRRFLIAEPNVNRVDLDEMC